MKEKEDAKEGLQYLCKTQSMQGFGLCNLCKVKEEVLVNTCFIDVVGGLETG